MAKDPTYDELEKRVIGLEKEAAERKLAKEAYHNLVQSSPMGIHFYELQDHDRLVFIGANPSADRLLGVDNQVFVGKTIEKAFPPLSQTEVPKRYRQAARQGIPWATEQINYEDHQIAGAFEVRAFQISPNKMAAEFIDITYRKRVEKSLKDSEKRYRLIAENVADVIWTMDMNFRFTYISPSILYLRGYTVEEALIQSLNETILPDSLAMIMGLVNQKMMLIESGNDEGWSPVIFEAEQYCKDGTIIWSHNNARFLPGPDKKPISMLGVTRDITGRKQMEEALVESEAKYRAMMESMKDPVYICSPDYRVEYMNPAMIKRTGHNAVGEPCFKALHNLDEKCSWCIHEKNGEYCEMDIVSPIDNRSYHISNSPIAHRDGSFSKMIVYRDTTELKKMEIQLQQAQRMEAIGTLAGGIAHDFNNILFPILGYLEMMLEDVPEDNPLHDHLAKVFNGAKRARDLVKQILTFSRQSENEKRPLKVQLVIKEVLKLIRSSLPTTIDIYQDISIDCELVMADPTQIHQIAMNLITNAYHAMDDETGGKLKVNLKEVELTMEDLKDPAMIPGPYVCLTVADTGPGMDQGTIARIFDPYFTTKEEGKGTGLGLSVVHGIVKSHGGHISVYSESDKGTEFKVYLPVIKPYETAQSVEADLPIKKGNERVLLVDDQELIVDIIRQMLERLEYHVTTRTSSTDALKTFRAQPDKFDLVITDMTMPNMTGDKLAGELIKIRSDIPVILCTGFSEMMSKEKANPLGIKGLLMKPVVMKDLSSMLREVLDD